MEKVTVGPLYVVVVGKCRLCLKIACLKEEQ